MRRLTRNNSNAVQSRRVAVARIACLCHATGLAGSDADRTLLRGPLLAVGRDLLDVSFEERTEAVGVSLH